jgi:predicted nucleic acid-binding protein
LTGCFEDERTPATKSVLDQLADHGAVAPSLWPQEVVNALLMAERRSRVNAAQRQRLTGFLQDLPIRLDTETAERAWNVTATLAAQHRLTLYDASYLELAWRTRLPLATLDKELRTAASALGLPLLGLAAHG